MNSFIEQYPQSFPEPGPAWLATLRRQGLDRFAALGLPSSDWESWRATPIAPLHETPFPWVGDYRGGLTAQKMEQLGHLPLNPMQGCDLVFVNGHFSEEFSSLAKLPKGVQVASLRQVFREHPEWVQPHLGRMAAFQEHPFVALNTAYLHDGAFIRVESGTTLEFPIHLVFVSTPGEGSAMSNPRTLVIAEAQSQVSIIESYLGWGDQPYFTNAVTEIVAQAGAVVDHYKLQGESDRAIHLGSTAVHQARDSQFNSHSISLGGALVRNDLGTVLAEEGAECKFNGLYLATDQQRVDNHTVIDHAYPHCTSQELYKGILSGKAHGVFHGKIVVRPGAAKTQARQTNKNLLLSDDAVINTTPLLEIFNNDVKCNHGATIGRLDPNQIFYLRARGIGLENAKQMLTYAFASDLIAHMRLRFLQVRLEEMVALRLARWRRSTEAA